MRLSPKYRAIIRGADTGILPFFVRILLAAGAGFYALAVAVRNKFYDRGWLKSHKLPLPVVCVGNITTGGTGKTPMVIWLCRFFLNRQVKPAILTRGYKACGSETNDEIQILQKALPDVPVIIDRNRVRGGQKALADPQVRVIVMDDGFQHRRLKRDLDVVLIDCTCPFGYDRLLPRGLLREPKNQLCRADMAILSRCDLIEKNMLDRLSRQVQQLLEKTKLKEIAAPKIVAHCRHEPAALYKAEGEKVNLVWLQGKKVLAFCGIGNPQAFIKTLRQLGADVIERHFFDDHHRYTDRDGIFLQAFCGKIDYDALVTTEKDWVKISRLPAVETLKDLYWLKIETVPTYNRQRLENRLDQICRDIKQEKP